MPDKIMKSLLLLFFLMSFSFASFAQDENESAREDEDKTVETEPAVKQNENPQPAVRGGSSVVTLSATVKGNQEQPKVLYIVPWQAAQDHRILYQPLNSQTNRVFDHIERSEHNRELKFISELGGETGEEK